MRRALVIFAAVALTTAPGLMDFLKTGEDSGVALAEQRAVSGRTSVADANGTPREVGEQKAEEAKQAEEARESVEEARRIIVARVNGADINMFMLVRAMNRVSPKYAEEGKAMSPETTKKIRKEALDRLIFEELAVQAALQAGINPAPEAIEKVVSQIKESLGSEQAYREYLDKSYLTEDALKKLIERSQRYELITAREIYGKVKVDERLVREEYEKEKGKFILPETLVVEDVFFLPGKDETTTRKRAEEILQEIGKNDNDVWKLVQDGTFIVRKVSVTREKYPEVYNAMTNMKAGDLSGIIRDKDGLHIIKVTKKEPSRQLTFEEARVALEPRFLVPAQDQRRQEWEDELRRNAKIEVMPEAEMK